MAFDYASVISAGLNFAGNAITNQINAERASSDMATYLNLIRKQRDWQNEDKQWSEDYSKRMMDYQNVNYSSPSAQMAAYKKAGINPWLAAQGGDVGSGQSVSPTAAPQPGHVSVTPFQRPELGNLMQGTADKIFMASSVRSQRIDAMAKFTQSLPALVKSVGKESATKIAGALFGQDIDMSRIDSMIQNEAVQQQYDTKIKEIQQNIAVEYGEKGAANAVALQEQAFAKVSAEIGLMSSNAKLNDAKIHTLAAEYCEKLAHAYNLRKQGDVYSVQAYILDNIKEYNIELQKLNMFRAQRQDVTERSLFESLRDVRSYQMNDPEAKEVQLENYKTNNDTFWNEVNVIMSSWQVHTNVGFSGSYGSKDVYGHGFGY